MDKGQGERGEQKEGEGAIRGRGCELAGRMGGVGNWGGKGKRGG